MIALRETRLFLRNLTLRVPFRYGIATMTHVPHLVVRVTAEIDGQIQHGYSADNLPPKWFTKNPDTSFQEEIEAMIETAQVAAASAHAIGARETLFAWSREILHAQERWAAERNVPALLAQFGASLIERAGIDAWCRAKKTTFAQAVRDNAFGIRLSAIHPELADSNPGDLLPSEPARSIIARHTVGMADPLEDAGHTGESDGLPHTLEEFIREQGLTHFKIKLGGDIKQDRARLRQISETIRRHSAPCAFTLDGNENFHAVAPFRKLWEGLLSDPTLTDFLTGLIFVEQPFHRDVALSAATTSDLLAWKERPPIIIDESDAGDEALRFALAGGYVGTSHKNCKGVFHGIANACLVESRRRATPDQTFHLSGEDLTNLGPIALPQDLAVVALLGLAHVERNGHHYFAGLSQFPGSVQQQVLRHHGDLYAPHPDGYPIVLIRRGAIAIDSVVDAPFGVAFEPELSGFTPVEDWRFDFLAAGADLHPVG